MRIIFLATYPQKITPAQRFRFEHYLPFLLENNIKYSYKTFLSEKHYKILYTKNNTIKKILIILFGFIKRTLLLGEIWKYDFIYIQREISIVGPPIFEWIFCKIFRKKIIYDFDDAIWVSMSSNANPNADKFKCTWKVKKICKWSYITTVGNSFLGQYASQFCKDVRIIETVVDTQKTHNKTKNQNDIPLTIGWTGTFTNFIHLPLVLPAIKKLQNEFNLIFLIIAEKNPDLNDIEYVFKKWNLETEIEDLLLMNIGIMPLIKTDVQLGKCAFKAIQYMSLGIPAVVSPVGANCEVVQNKITGYWADNNAEWYNTLKLLITDELQRKNMGMLSQKVISDKYSVNATKNLFLDLFS